MGRSGQVGLVLQTLGILVREGWWQLLQCEESGKVPAQGPTDNEAEKAENSHFFSGTLALEEHPCFYVLVRGEGERIWLPSVF